MYVFRFQKPLQHTVGTDDFGGGRTFGRRDTTPFCHDATDLLFGVAMGLTRTTAVFRLFATTGHFLTRGEDRLPAIFALHTAQLFGSELVDEELTALDTDTTQNLLDHLEELDVIDRAGEFIVSEMAGTLVVVETTRTAEFAVLKNTHTRVGETPDHSFLGAMLGDFHHGTSFNFFRAENTKLDAYNGFGF
jgi:hypothetical protein